MRLTFEAIGHTYAVNGSPVDLSVSQVLKAAGVVDYSHIPLGQLGPARERGIAVHLALHYYNEGDLDVARFAADYPDYLGYLEAWQSFCLQRRFEVALCEHLVYSPRHHVAGTIDCLGMLDGHAALLDFATGDPDDAAKDLQTAGYLIMALDWQAHDPALRAFLRHMPITRYGVALRRDGTFRMHAYTEPADGRHFLALLDAVRIVARRKRMPAPEAV